MKRANAHGSKIRKVVMIKDLLVDLETGELADLGIVLPMQKKGGNNEPKVSSKTTASKGSQADYEVGMNNITWNTNPSDN
mgnify:CR=1 FL=1|jgi:hypothetical protein